MDPRLRSLLAAAERSGWTEDPGPKRRRRRVSAELDRLGLFLRLGRAEAFLCTEADAAWGLRRAPDGLDLRAWRLHLIVGRVPRR